MTFVARIKAWARRIKRDAVALWFAYRHPQTPRLVKLLCVTVVAYALSPIDLIPDFIPILGFVDDAILLPALIWLTVRLMPAEVMAHSRERADAWMTQQGKKPTSRMGAVLIVGLWILMAWFIWQWLHH